MMKDTENIRWKQRFQNFEKALTVFKERCSDVEEHPKGSKYYDAFQMALVQAFEILIELSWKVLKDYLENEGYTEVKTGKRVFRQAFQDGIIENGELNNRYAAKLFHFYHFIKTLQQKYPDIYYFDYSHHSSFSPRIELFMDGDHLNVYSAKLFTSMIMNDLKKSHLLDAY